MAIPIRELIWITFGFIGQALFSLRFLTQWLASEKAKQTIIPFSFWVYSILGSIILSIYAIYRKDPVFILGQLPSVFVYIRNVMIYRDNNKKNKEKKESTLSG